jgi:hypothetical protein
MSKKRLTRDGLFAESGERIHEMGLVVIDTLVKGFLVACSINRYATNNISLALCISKNNSPSRFNDATFPANSIHQIERRKTNLIFVEADHTAEYLRHCSDK